MVVDLLKTQLLEVRHREYPACETIYNGYHFKTRLEARWAVFFDALEIPYRYEHEEFQIGEMRYTPKFYLPTVNSWVDIKGIEPDPTEDLKANLLALATKQNTYIYYSDCWRPDELLRQGNDGAYGYIARDTDYGLDVFWENHCWWTQCKTCETFGITPGGRSDLLPCKHDAEGTINSTSIRLLAAYMKARGARFENTQRLTVSLVPLQNLN